MTVPGCMPVPTISFGKDTTPTSDVLSLVLDKVKVVDSDRSLEPEKVPFSKLSSKKQ